MANLSDIRARIQSVKNTQKITQAMKMVSAAKLRKAQDNITNLRPYAKGLLTVIADVALSQRVEHPLLSLSTEINKVLMVVITSDRGLCGGFNNSVNKYAFNFHKENKDKYEVLDFLFIGKKAREYFKARDLQGVDTILNLSKEISFDMAEEVAERVQKEFADGQYDSIQVVYSEFKSAIQQDVVCETLLPVDISHGHNEESDDGAKGSSHSKDIIFEPKPVDMIEDLLGRHFTTQVYRCMSESVASEHGARMTAMENSTNNANDMISTMTITYNNLRQAAITTELIEITSGAEALKN